MRSITFWLDGSKDHKHVADHKRASSSEFTFEDTDVLLLVREDRWSDRGVSEALYIKLEQSPLNGGGGL